MQKMDNISKSKEEQQRGEYICNSCLWRRANFLKKQAKSTIFAEKTMNIIY